MRYGKDAEFSKTRRRVTARRETVGGRLLRKTYPKFDSRTKKMIGSPLCVS